MVVELVGNAGVERVCDELHALQIVPARPFVGILHAEAEARVGSQTEPHAVVDLMRHVEGRNGPGLMGAVIVARVVACGVSRVHAPVELGHGKVGLHLRSIKERHGGRVVGKRGRIAATGDESAGQAHASGTVFHDGEPFRLSAGRGEKKSKRNKKRTEKACAGRKTVHCTTPAAAGKEDRPTKAMQ